MNGKSTSGPAPAELGKLLRVQGGALDLAALDPRSTPGFDGDKATAVAAVAELGPELAELQERLFAQGISGGTRSLLLVLQGMDTSGKGGTVRNVVGLVDPQGVRIAGFKKPTEEELAHDFLWRIRRALPGPGMLGVFDRSHYESVLIERVRNLVPPEQWVTYYDAINLFEAELVAAGTPVLKICLHIDADIQKERLLARLDNPAKHWKFNEGDLVERRVWSAYREAYEVALTRCDTEAAPWYVVPAGRKWYRDWAVATLLRDALLAMDLDWPDPGLDVPALRARLETEQPT
ncbi:MAG: PPK2 family polyphosphate kinase [Sporichthyaceae bacterium]